MTADAGAAPNAAAPPLALLRDGPPDAAWTLALAHGAGAPMDSPFMAGMAERLAVAGVAVARFEFPYMRRTRADGRRRPPDRQRALLTAWREAVAAIGDAAAGGASRLAIGGKSLGGRAASMIADEAGAAALVVLGFPFHPPGAPDRTRTERLAALRTPALICQGERDPFGGRAEVEAYDLAPSIALHWIADGNHSFEPRKASGRTLGDNLDDAAAAVARFLGGLE